MLPLVLALALSASPEPVRVATTGWSFVGIEPALGEVFLERFVTELGKRGGGRLAITTQRDVSQLLGLEREKQLLGCGEGSCLAELAGALGVELILSGTIAKTAEGYTATLRALDTKSGSVRFSESTRASSEAAVQDWLDAQASAVAVQLAGVPEAPATPTVVKLIPGFVGLALAGGGAAALAVSRSNAAALQDTTRPFSSADEVVRLANDGRALEGLGVGLLVGAGAAIAASAVWLAVSPPGRQLSASVVVDSTGGAIVFSGRLP